MIHECDGRTDGRTDRRTDIIMANFAFNYVARPEILAIYHASDIAAIVQKLLDKRSMKERFLLLHTERGIG